MKLTINQLLELQSELSSRLGRLESIQLQVSTKERTFFGNDSQKTTEKEPQYDPKVVDAKISELRNFLFKSKSAIKQANASTVVDLDVNVDSLLGTI